MTVQGVSAGAGYLGEIRDEHLLGVLRVELYCGGIQRLCPRPE